MRRTLSGLAAATAVAALGLAGCGSDDQASERTSASTGKEGGTATIYHSSFPDYLDPALSYTVDGWQALWVTYTPLLTFRHVAGKEGSTLIPGLAKALPEVSDDGKTYDFTLRKGLVYSDGSKVKASDFEHAVKRVLNLESGGSSFFQGIVGAEAYLDAGKAKRDIKGITTDDDAGTISIKLTKADGQFGFKLALPFSAPVPASTPFSNQTKSPPPGVGAFVVKNVKGTRSYTLVKNTKFKGFDGVPVAKLSRIRASVVKESRRQGQDVIANKVDYLIDPPIGEQLREARKLTDRFKEFTTISTYYMFLNTREEPFDDKRVRQAASYAINKRALARLFSGLIEPTCNFLPPNMTGHETIDPCPYGDPTAAPDLAKARALIEEAGAQGATVDVWGNDEDETKQVTEALADQLSTIGLKARPKVVEGSVYYQTIGNQKTKAQAGFANWFADFPHPENFLFLVEGKTIQETNNQNFGNVDDPEINSIVESAGPNADLDAVADQYAKADKRIIDEALAVPFGNRKLTLLTSNRLAFDDIVWHPLYNADYSTFALK